MAKRKTHDSNEMNSAESTTHHGGESEQLPELDPPTDISEPSDPLMEEVQSFLNLRDELARKLATEIDALEEKLAELKKTAASLFPGSDSDSTGDRKAKKPKAKSSSQKEKPDTGSSPEQKTVTEE
jgi:hypothetical protein